MQKKSCPYGFKCLFAHGTSDLRARQTETLMFLKQNFGDKKNPENYKIVKCKFFDRNGTCRYGSLCSFAHGDRELRTKADNIRLLKNNIQPQEHPVFNPNVPSQNIMPYNNQFFSQNNLNFGINSFNNSYSNNLGINPQFSMTSITNRGKK